MESHRQVWIRSIPVLLLPFLFLWLITQQTEIPWRYFFMDLAVALQVPILACVVTGATTILWCSSGLLSIFCAQFCEPKYRAALLVLGILSLVLGIDDLIMLHETLLPHALNMTKKLQSVAVEACVFSCYAAVMFVWLWKFFRLTTWASRPFLLLSLSCFAFSLAADFASSYKVFGKWSRFRTDYDFQLLVEDGPKLVGVVFWAVFVWHFAKSTMPNQSSTKTQ